MHLKDRFHKATKINIATIPIAIHASTKTWANAASARPAMAKKKLIMTNYFATQSY
jgi:hypothetical protein